MSTQNPVGAANRVMQGGRDSYELVEPLGKGGFGLTWKARRKSDGQTVVVKQLRVERVDDWKAVELFEREGRALAALKHPRIPAYIDSFTLEDTGFVLVQEYVQGPTLQALIEQKQAPEAGAMFNWFWGMLEVCEYLHSQHPPVIHRDITPKNIILRDPGLGEAALIDFGTVQAKLISHTAISSTAAGTFGYAPPEQFIGHATPGSDLYGLAMSFLAVALSTPPERMPMANGRVDVQAALRQAGNLDARLQLVLADMLQVDLGRRPESAREVMQRLAPLRRAGGSQMGAPTQTPQTPAAAGLHDAWHRAPAPAGGADSSGVSAAPAGFTPDKAPEVKPWLDAYARRQLIGTDAWTSPPEMKHQELESVVFSPCGTRAFLVCRPGCWVLDLETMRARLVLQQAYGFTEWLGAFSADGARLLIVNCATSEAQLLDVVSVDSIATPEVFSFRGLDSYWLGVSAQLALSPDYRSAVLWSWRGVGVEAPRGKDGGIAILDLVERKVRQTVVAMGERGVEFSPDGQYIVCHGPHATQILATSGEDVTLEDTHISLSLNGFQLAALTEYQDKLQLGPIKSLLPLEWQAGVKKPFGPRFAKHGQMKAMRYSPDGRQLLLAYEGGGSQGGYRLLLLDAQSAAVNKEISSTLTPGSRLRRIMSFGLNANGRYAYAFGEGVATYWRANRQRCVMCWDVSGTEPRYIGAIGVIRREYEGQAPYDESNFLNDVVVGVLPLGYFSRLDCERGLCGKKDGGLIHPWEQPGRVRSILRGAAAPAKDERARALEADLEQRGRFFLELFEAGRLASHAEVSQLADASVGLTHLLPEVLARAEADNSGQPRFGATGDGPLSTHALLDACAQLNAMDPQMQQVVWEEMLERCRAQAVQAHAVEQGRLRSSKGRRIYFVLAIVAVVALTLVGIGVRMFLMG